MNMDSFRVIRDFSEYQGVPATGAAAWNRLGEPAAFLENPYQDFGTMSSQNQGRADIYERSYGPQATAVVGRKGGNRYDGPQSLMQGMKGGRQSSKKVVVIRRQRTAYPYNPVPDSMEHKDFAVSPNNVFNFHGYQSLFTLQHRFDFIIDGVTYKSVDQFYQMRKVKDLTGLESGKFTDGSTRNYSALAKELLRQSNIKRPDIDNWRTGRGVEVIQKALLDKVRQCYDLRSAITSTADKLIVHSYNGDDFFGSGCPAKYVKDWCSGMEKNKVSLKYPMMFPLTADCVKYVPILAKGKNVLGAIYMILREKINNGQLDSLAVSLGSISIGGSSKAGHSGDEPMNAEFSADSSNF